MTTSEQEVSTDGEEAPPTDLCEECGDEILPEIIDVEGRDKLIHQARQADEGFMPVTAGKATVDFSCRCSHVRVEFGPGSCSAWDVPDGWMWEDEIDV